MLCQPFFATVFVGGTLSWLKRGVEALELDARIGRRKAPSDGGSLLSGLSNGLSVGLLFGLLMGGWACLRHYVLRLLLWHAGAIPWNDPRFLNYAVERIFLRKVGGGYMFVHRLLLEYFASLDNIPPLDEARA